MRGAEYTVAGHCIAIIPAMQDRLLTPLDRLPVGVNNALRIIATPAGHSVRGSPADDIAEAELSDKQRTHSAGPIRVNHAGEIAAQALCQGHVMVARDSSIDQRMRD